MKIICPMMLVPIRDYFESRKKLYKVFIFPGLAALISFVLITIIKPRTDVKICDSFLNFINVQISGIAILISFTIAVLTILVTSGNQNVEELKTEKAHTDQYNPIKISRDSDEREKITLFQVLLSGITYNVLTEALFLVGLFFELFLQATVNAITIKIIISIDVFFIIHILYVLCLSITDIYFVFWKR